MCISIIKYHRVTETEGLTYHDNYVFISQLAGQLEDIPRISETILSKNDKFLCTICKKSPGLYCDGGTYLCSYCKTNNDKPKGFAKIEPLDLELFAIILKKFTECYCFFRACRGNYCVFRACRGNYFLSTPQFNRWQEA
jgi:hypothetical protein